MKIAFITGSYPPDVDGIGDYTHRLVHALSEQGVSTEVILKNSWRICRARDVLDSIRKTAPDLVHIQYPTGGYGWHLTPQLLSLAVPGVVTVHEASKAHILRKLSLLPFSLRSRHIVFTTAEERDFAVRYTPWIHGRCSVIPIGSNIRTGKPGQRRDTSAIVYFGLIRPNKGIEDVLRLASLLKQMKLDYRVHIIGKPFPDDSSYYRRLRNLSDGLPVAWSTDLDDERVADLLSVTAFAYLPFPDGASGRRGSLLASLANGVATVTTRGAHTPHALAEAVLFSRSADDALGLIEKLRSDDSLSIRLSENGRAYANQFSWKTIARTHAELYDKLITTSRGER